MTMKLRIRWPAVFCAAGLLFPAVAWGQPAEATVPVESRTEAYRLFLLGRHLEGQGDVEGAIRVFREAAELDRETGEILAELASLYAVEKQVENALRAANDALAQDPENLTAHRVLGLILAAQSTAPDGAGEDAARAIEHLEQAREAVVPDDQVIDTLARLYLHQGQTEQAIQLLENETGFSGRALLLSEAYERAGRSDDAIAVVEDVAAASRPSSRTLWRLGELYGRADRWPDAVRAYEAATTRDPRNARIRHALADALVRAGEAGRARNVLRELVDLRPTDGSAWYRLAEVELNLGDFEAAEAAARQLIALDPDGVQGAYVLAQVQARRHDYRAVIETLEPAVLRGRTANLRPSQIASLLGRLAFAHERLQQFDAASRIYAEAVELLPDSFTFGARLVQSYLDAGRVEEARAALNRVQSRHTVNLTLVRLEARLLGDQGDVDAGARVLQRVLERRAGDPAAHIALAGFYAQHDRLDQAVDLLEVATASFPDNVSIHFQFGAVLERSARYADAEQAFRRVLERDPTHAVTLNYLGYMLADRGVRLDESVALLERAIAIDPHNGAYLDSLGWAYFKLDRLALAETHLRQASEQMAWNSVIHDHLGDLLFRLERYDEAIEAWEAALAGDREDVESAAIERKMEDARRRLTR